MVDIFGQDNPLKMSFLEVYGSINDYQLEFTYHDNSQSFFLKDCKKLIFKEDCLLIVYKDYLELFYYENIDNFKLFKWMINWKSMILSDRTIKKNTI